MRNNGVHGFSASWCFLQCDFAGAETLTAALVGADDKRTFVVDAHGGAGDAVRSGEHSYGAAAQRIVAVPEIGKGFLVTAIHEALVGLQDASDERGGEAVEIERLAGVFCE